MMGTPSVPVSILFLVFLLISSSALPAAQARPIRGRAADAPTDVQVSTSAAVFQSWPEMLLGGYLSNSQLEAWSLDFTTRCSSIARRFSIGKSVSGSDLWVIEIAAHPGKVEAKPNFKYVGNMHGDEPGGRVLLPMLAEWLCSKQGTDPRASRIINGMHLFILPTMNPDGYQKRQRYNALGVDLNRDFPSPFKAAGCRGKAPEACDPLLLSLAANSGVQPETAAIMAWSSNDSWPFTAAANLHEGAIVANYPWDGYLDGSLDTRGIDHRTTEQSTFVHLAEAYSMAHPTMGKSPLFENGITNGAAWYPVYSSMQDWDYAAAGCMDITLELSQDKFPEPSTLAAQWADNLNPLLALPITAVLGGVSGQVTDSATGNPVKGATVTVDGVSMKSAARGPLAYYNRPLAPGNWTITVSAPGYKPASATLTVPASGQGVKQDFKLLPSGRTPGGSSSVADEGGQLVRQG